MLNLFPLLIHVFFTFKIKGLNFELNHILFMYIKYIILLLFGKSYHYAQYFMFVMITQLIQVLFMFIFQVIKAFLLFLSKLYQFK